MVCLVVSLTLSRVVHTNLLIIHSRGEGWDIKKNPDVIVQQTAGVRRGTAGLKQPTTPPKTSAFSPDRAFCQARKDGTNVLGGFVFWLKHVWVDLFVCLGGEDRQRTETRTH